MLWFHREKKKAQYETAINFLFSKREVDDNQIRTKKGWKEFAQFSTFPWKQILCYFNETISQNTIFLEKYHEVNPKTSAHAQMIHFKACSDLANHEF